MKHKADGLPLRLRFDAPIAYIYAIYCHELNLVKIGISRDIRQRLRDLQRGIPVDLILLAWRLGTEKDEVELHKKFARHRHRAEWFRLHLDITKEIESWEKIVRRWPWLPDEGMRRWGPPIEESPAYTFLLGE